MKKLIEVDYRQWGSYSSYVECGHYKVDEFGDRVFVRECYPKDDDRLKCKFELSGRYGKNSTNTILEIIVPENYPLVIRQKFNQSAVQKGSAVDLYTPQDND